MSQPRRAACVVLTLLWGCSRPASSDTQAEASAAGPRAPATVSALGSPPPVALSAGPILTPEDVEPEVEHRITEQNLESELDRLEREIQAE